MNNEELTLEQLTVFSAAGLFINTNGSASSFAVVNLAEGFRHSSRFVSYHGDEIHFD